MRPRGLLYAVVILLTVFSGGILAGANPAFASTEPNTLQYPTLQFIPSKIESNLRTIEITGALERATPAHVFDGGQWSFIDRPDIHGINVFLEGKGFNPGQPVFLEPLPGQEEFWKYADLNNMGRGWIVAADGTFGTCNLDIAIPATPGTYGVRATQGNLEAIAFLEVRSVEPISVSISPQKVFPGQTLNVHVSGLWADQYPNTVIVYEQFGQEASLGAQSPPGGISNVTLVAVSEFKRLKVSPQGTLDFTWTTGSPDGTLDFVLKNRWSLDARPQTLVINQPGRNPVKIPIALDNSLPVLTANPTSISSGQEITLSGSNFTPNIPVTLIGEGMGPIDVDPLTGAGTGAIDVTPSEEGTFIVVLRPQLPPGGHIKITATQPGRDPVSVSLTSMPQVKQNVTIQLTIGQKQANVNGKIQRLVVPPLIRQGRTMVPLRFIGEAMGAVLDWDPAERKVTYTREGRQVILWIDNPRVVVNGATYSFEPAPFVEKGTTLVPVRLVAEALRFTVLWDKASQTVTIASGR